MSSPHSPLSTVEDYVPQQEELVNSFHLLQALRDPTRSDHGRALASLDEHVANPSFVLVMMHVFSAGAQYQAQGLTTDLRQLAGLIIKNYVFKHLAILPVNVQTMLKKQIVQVLQDSIADIRKTGAILAGKISESFSVTTWCDMLPPILQMLDVGLFPTHLCVLEGALEATQRICEDSALKLAQDSLNRPLDTLIPKLLALMTCSEASIRIGALSSYNALLYLLNPANFDTDHHSQVNSASAMGNASYLITHMNAFIQNLAHLSTDPNTKVRTLVCQAITTISTTHVAVLDAYFDNICVFMLAALQDTQECVAIESCEFWAVMLETPDTKIAIMPYLNTLVQHLVSRLYLTQEQMDTERNDEASENSGEKELNLRPIHHKNGSNTGSAKAEDKETAELSTRWTLRKQAALLLDTVALSFPPADVLTAALPRIQECFQHENVLVRECGMLALGALSTGCVDEMAQYIPQLFPFLLQHVQDPLPEMRSISCWVLSRYCSLYECMNDSDASSNSPTVASVGSVYYTQTLQVLLSTMFDAMPKVQIAACSALAILIENSFYVSSSDNNNDSDSILLPHVHTILSACARAFDVYGVKASLVLVDTIGTIADTIGADLQNAQYTELYLPKLVRKFNELDDLDMRMFPMLECLSSVLSAIGLDAQQYVLQIYNRCLRIATTVLKEHAEAGPSTSTTDPDSENDNDDEDDLPHKDFVICALDVISALCEGLHDVFSTLVLDTQTHTTLFSILFAACNDGYAELRQSGFSLAGEVCKFCFSTLIDVNIATTMVQSAIRNLHIDYPLVCNNAAWCIGNLALHCGGEFLVPYIASIMHALITGLQCEELQDNIKVNIAVTIGRLAMGDKLEVAELADEYFADWCSILELPCPHSERVHAYTGMLNILHQNPHLLLNNKTNLYSYLVALLAWQEAPPDSILAGLREVLVVVRTNNTTLFNKVLSKFALHYDVTALVNMYQLSA